jgi:hypothetical protein
MKLAKKQVWVFRPALPWPGRRRLPFFSRRNTVQLLETALVIEGYQQRLRWPVLDMFFREALCERTMVTVPYSRIVGFRLNRMLVPRLLLALLLWLPAALIALSTALDSYGSFDVFGSLCPLLLYGVGALVVTLLMLYWLSPRYHLLHRRADGGLSVVALQIRPRKLREAFVTRLEENRRAAASTVPPTAARGDDRTERRS